MLKKQSKPVIPHPFFPRNASIPHYVPNTTSIEELLGIFFGLLFVALVGTWLLTSRKTLRFGVGDRLILCWFVGCGFIHTILEGYFCVFNETLAGKETYLAQMWKEYGKADSRYLTSDSFTVCMESITAFLVGPLCFGVVLAYVTRNPSRYVLQLVVSICHLYGDSLYMSIEAKEGFIHGEYNHPLHFWFYFVFLNLWWIFVPLVLITQACLRLVEAQRLSDIRPNVTNSKSKKRK
ncbi:3-beta-hydroxysteroid-Delta(8),Delta(7)-isomerase-like [Ylistrum balloti]|uniref:3-beta-hydroxysteroid-Delta(8), Delta(7)-isomerase-like n=1 Tax=Ylistrum balloti TaxID=509963 RepID=UPI002905A9F2|nr:3-beta-hydroxysteroid-Delta(8),Delta(7)-isomerase-like [Ylistrum balloti]